MTSRHLLVEPRVKRNCVTGNRHSPCRQASAAAPFLPPERLARAQRRRSTFGLAAGGGALGAYAEAPFFERDDTPAVPSSARGCKPRCEIRRRSCRLAPG